jgi:putative Ca2+/H+ antiporter (TMEM165/GDT1 family)
MSDFGAAMKDSGIRFYAVEHFSMMFIAVVLVHIGRAKSKKAKTDLAKFKTATIFYLLALVIILAAIPWSRV